MLTDIRFTILLNERQAKAVAQESKKQGLSKGEVIRRIIDKALGVKVT